VKDEYDPIRKTGLLPKNGGVDRRKLQYENNAGGQAYIVGGTMISGNRSAFADEFVHERMGREKGRKLKRRKDDQAEEEALQRLLKNEMASGSTGAKYLRTIQELNNSKDKSSDKRAGSSGPRDTADAEDKPITGMPFKIETIRKIGFNPAAYNDPLQGLRVSEETSKTVSK
jgi:minichromosome maintenance protein 10